MRSTKRAARRIAGAWERLRARRESQVVTLDALRRRLELLLTAMYGKAIAIDAAAPVQRTGVLRRWLDGTPSHLRGADALAASDGEHVRLPRTLTSASGPEAARALYRLLAIEQAERVARGTVASLPAADAPLERDLYAIAEGLALDAHIASSVPGLRATLASARAGALAQRPAPRALTPLEREVEVVLRDALAHDVVRESGMAATPAESLAWAARTASELRARTRDTRYRGIASVTHWGTIVSPASGSAQSVPDGTTVTQTSRKVQERPSRPPRPKSALSSHASEQLTARVEDSSGTPSDRATLTDDVNATDGTSSDEGDRILNETPETGDGAGGAGFDALGDRAAPAPGRPTRTEYPEWDFNLGAYRSRGATVVACAAPEASDAWARATLAERGVLARQVRAQFERLRARRLRLPRQQDGDELDVAACVRALVDLRMGRSPDDRLFVAVHPARQAIAIALLVDISGSTNASVVERRTDPQQVIEVEKTALLLASEALDALGDRYAILTFASHGAHDVRVAAIKEFAERNGDTVRGRISAIAPHGNTRLGAAIRHATALLAEQPVGHRLLLILSDGKPSDTDRYFESYGVEDSRQAILEARTEGVFPFCLAVSSEQAPTYLSHIFGPAGHTVLSNPEHLPGALLRVIRNLLGAR